ncbi:MAG: hypothetical protein KY459_14860, partial [Acidobacteria bacterium]|nr:hypothetical protein [Acidobacteriota bacterium]
KQPNSRTQTNVILSGRSGGQAKDLAGWDIRSSEALQRVEVQQFHGCFIRSRRRTAKDLVAARERE